MKNRIFIFIIFISLLSICFHVYATEEEAKEVQEEVILDDISLEDLALAENEEEIKEENTSMNKYTFLTLVIFVFFVVYIFYKLGINKKLLSIVISVIIGICADIIVLFILDKISSLYIKIAYKPIAIAALGVTLYTTFCIIQKLDEQKNKTEDVDWKVLFKEGINLQKTILLGLCNLIFLGYIGIGMFYTNGINITKEMAYIAISGSIGMITSGIIVAFMYSVLNYKKTIYKTTSENKVDGKRSLKL